jgi:hypothetical protein
MKICHHGILYGKNYKILSILKCEPVILANFENDLVRSFIKLVLNNIKHYFYLIKDLPH